MHVTNLHVTNLHVTNLRVTNLPLPYPSPGSHCRQILSLGRTDPAICTGWSCHCDRQYIMMDLIAMMGILSPLSLWQVDLTGDNTGRQLLWWADPVFCLTDTDHCKKEFLSLHSYRFQLFCQTVDHCGVKVLSNEFTSFSFPVESSQLFFLIYPLFFYSSM